MALITRLTNEKSLLYRVAGHQPLAPHQKGRLDELNGQLPLSWERYRREDASERWGTPREQQYLWKAA
jgi:hypothetical protein